MPHRHHHADPDRTSRRVGRPTAIAVAALTAVAPIAWSSVADAAPTNGCGAAWTLATDQEFVLAAVAANDVDRGAEYERRLYEAFELADRNEDDLVCYRFNTGNRGQDKVYVDPSWGLDDHYVITNVNDNNSRPL